jgi:hypothetical protein
MLVALGQGKKGRQIRAIGDNDKAERGDKACQDHAHICHPPDRSIHDSLTSPQHNRKTDKRDGFIWFIWFL